MKSEIHNGKLFLEGKEVPIGELTFLEDKAALGKVSQHEKNLTFWM